MQITVRYAGEDCILDVEPTTTVGEMKQMLSEKQPGRFGNTRNLLFHAPQDINDRDWMTMEAAGIYQGAIIYVTAKVVFGFSFGSTWRSMPRLGGNPGGIGKNVLRFGGNSGGIRTKDDTTKSDK